MSRSLAGGRHLRREHNSLSLNVDRGKTWGAPGLALFETSDSHGHVNLGVLFDGVTESP